MKIGTPIPRCPRCGREGKLVMRFPFLNADSWWIRHELKRLDPTEKKEVVYCSLGHKKEAKRLLRRMGHREFGQRWGDK